MKRILTLLLIVTACGDSTGPQARCEAEKRAWLADHFGADYNPTPSLLLQDVINLSDTKQVVFAADCSATVRDTPH